MFTNSTAQDVGGRTSPQGDPERTSSGHEVNGAHLNEIRQRLLVEPKALNEARVAWALEIHSFLTGTRGIARWTHQHKETVQGLAGPDGGLSKHRLLYTSSRGRSSVIEEEREDMELRFNSLAGRYWSPLGASGYRSFAAQHLSKISISSLPLVEMIMEEGLIKRGNGRETTGIAEDLGNVLVLAEEQFKKLTEWGTAQSWTHRLMTLFDPAEDTWADEGEGLGKHAWRLAVLFGGQDVFVTQQDLMVLTGLAERPVRRLLDRWRKNPLGLVLEHKVGRSKVYALRFFSVLNPAGAMYGNHLGAKTKLWASAAKDTKERATAARRGTPEGAIAWRACSPRTRQAFLDDLPQDADPQWRELVEAGNELECHAYLVEQTQEAGPVPTTPEAVSAPQETQPAPESPLVRMARRDSLSGDPEVSPEERRLRLAEMRARIAEPITEQEPVAGHTAPVPERSAEETEDDLILRTTCMGRQDLFWSVYGRLPNQSKPEPTARELKRRRGREAVEERRRSREQATA